VTPVDLLLSHEPREVHGGYARFVLEKGVVIQLIADAEGIFETGIVRMRRTRGIH
jgi:hypothetical protein